MNATVQREARVPGPKERLEFWLKISNHGDGTSSCSMIHIAESPRHMALDLCQRLGEQIASHLTAF